MNRVRLVGLGLAVMAWGVGMLAPRMPAEAATVLKAGWWYRTSDPASAIPREASSPLVPDAGTDAIAPPVPEGYLHIEGTPEGATAVAAVTYALRHGEDSPVLTIVPDDDSISPSELIVLACRAAVPWPAPSENPGRWQNKPIVDCGRSVNGIVNDDGTITFALQLLISGPELDVVLVPGLVDESAQVGSTFSLSFSASRGMKIVTTETPSREASPRDRSHVEGGRSSGAFAPVAAGAVAPTAAQPALAPEEQAPTVPVVPTPAVSSPVAETTARRGVGIAALLLGSAIAAVAYVRPTRERNGAKGVGRFRGTAGGAARGEQMIGGLGRYARPRTSRPAALS